MTTTEPRVGIALSGGGFRATAFGLGCLRALHDQGLLPHVRVVSGISGGSLLAAMWAYGPASFTEFDDTVTELLRSGLQRELMLRAASPTSLARSLTHTLRSTGTGQPRRYTRTNSLLAALAARAFGAKNLTEVTHPGLDTVLSATDLETTNAIRFGSRVSACSPHGTISDCLTVADAVAASAAFPLLLPPISREFTFQPLDGQAHRRRVLLTDGGVYDNLGLSPLLPGRSLQHTSHVYELDYIIACDAGRGRTPITSRGYLPMRLKRSFDITYEKTQDSGRARIHEAQRTGQITGFVHAYLAMKDNRLPAPLVDLVPRVEIIDYPTNFAKMSQEHLDALSTRGEQLTRVLLAYYCPRLLA
ncbi:patatin-like phospholipase family protein [Nocardia sp. CA2R105]|uniref:patatin-like phospholipase family protein n=1 Tax=Nocardia coffeae TaxID=2873381 RepID=UPI001CA63FDF|nr:patatin-like phospholipase family protein [Nocardia coffeae]MBY8861224.1 patatin-like phospholipase family protein [Nocardia coffeae]